MHTPLTFNLQSVSLVIFFEQPTLYLSGRVLNETLTKKIHWKHWTYWFLVQMLFSLIFMIEKREILTDVLSGRSCFHGGKLQSEEFFATNY